MKRALIATLITCFWLACVVGMWSTEELTVAGEIEVLIQPYADILGPPTTITFSGTDLYVWWGNGALVLRRGDRWNIVGITSRGQSTIPPLHVALMVQAKRAKQKRGEWNVRPIAPWSVTVAMPDEALHPEQR